jgi:hypothetical protein
VYQAHEDARQKLRDLIGVPASLDPLEEEATTGVDTSIIDEFPRYLELKTLKGYFGEIMAAVVAENLNAFDEDWRIFAFPFRLHQTAYHALEQVRQARSSAPTIIGRLGDDMLAFQLNDQGAITHVLFCEAKCTADHNIDLISEAHQKSSDSKIIPVDCLPLIDILKDYAITGSEAEVWIHALRKLYLSHTAPTHERCDLINYICGLPPAKASTVIIPTAAPHSKYTAGRRLEAVEIHLHDVNGLIEDIYQAITPSIPCSLDEMELISLWNLVVIHIPEPSKSFIEEHCSLLAFNDQKAVIGVDVLEVFRDVQRQIPKIKAAFELSGKFTPSKVQKHIDIRLKVA